MLKVYDTRCEDCGQVIEQYIEDNELFKNCPVCDGTMNRMFSTMNYKLIYNNKTDVCSWGDYGYATSQYWSKVKEVEEKTGKKHKPVDEI